MEVRIQGYAKTRRVTINGESLSPKESQAIRNHSPDGFCWGYEGSGPAQLALAICLKFDVGYYAEMYYQDFKREVVAKLPIDEDFDIDIDVEAWATRWMLKHTGEGE